MNEDVRILIVDDNPRARDGLAAFVSMQEGLRVVSEAANGEDALKKIESEVPDLVLMDVEMPVMDGFAATRAIKERWPRIRVIILTIYADALCLARQAGADGFVVKGGPLEELLSLMTGLQKVDQDGIAACERPEPRTPFRERRLVDWL